MGWKEMIVMPAAVVAIGMFWITWEAKQKKSEQEVSFQVPDSDNPQVYVDFMRELHAEIPYLRSAEQWHYKRAYASMQEAADRLRELIPTGQKLPPFAALCDVCYRVANSVGLDGLSPDEIQAVLDDFETYVSRQDALPTHKQDRLLLSNTLTMVLVLSENQGNSKQEMLDYATRLQAKIDSFEYSAFKTSAIDTIVGFRNRVELLQEPYNLVGDTLEGVVLDTAKFQGKVVLIEFWATTCGPCVSELPQLLSIYEANQNDIAIVGVSKDRSKRTLKRFVEDREIPWPQFWMDHDMGNADFFETLSISQIPYSILLDRSGRVVAFNVRADSIRKWL